MYLREVGGKLGQLDKGERHVIATRRRYVAITVQNTGNARSTDEVVGKVEVERRESLGCQRTERGSARN